ncbi:MAG: hypothetical protein LUE90_08730, partial [Clostridiales bacterium]|nr:hypothetical protein [Clostridiales bacterium]
FNTRNRTYELYTNYFTLPQKILDNKMMGEGMDYPDYTDLLEKITYVEGILRMAEKYRDPLPLEAVIRDPEMEEVIKKFYHFSDGRVFCEAFENAENFHDVLNVQFAGEKLLFHLRKHRGEHVLPNTHVIFCPRGGCVVRIKGQQELYLNEGEACVVAPGVSHAYFNLSETARVIHLAITASFMSTVLFPRLPQTHPCTQLFHNVIFDHDAAVPYIFVPKSFPEEMTYFLTSAFYYYLYRPAMYEEIVNSFLVLFFLTSCRQSAGRQIYLNPPNCRRSRPCR